jgi:hypothetical protein
MWEVPLINGRTIFLSPRDRKKNQQKSIRRLSWRTACVSADFNQEFQT